MKTLLNLLIFFVFLMTFTVAAYARPCYKARIDIQNNSTHPATIEMLELSSGKWKNGVTLPINIPAHSTRKLVATSHSFTTGITTFILIRSASKHIKVDIRFSLSGLATVKSNSKDLEIKFFTPSEKVGGQYRCKPTRIFLTIN